MVRLLSLCNKDCYQSWRWRFFPSLWPSNNHHVYRIRSRSCRILIRNYLVWPSCSSLSKCSRFGKMKTHQCLQVDRTSIPQKREWPWELGWDVCLADALGDASLHCRGRWTYVSDRLNIHTNRRLQHSFAHIYSRRCSWAYSHDAQWCSNLLCSASI